MWNGKFINSVKFIIFNISCGLILLTTNLKFGNIDFFPLSNLRESILSELKYKVRWKRKLP